MLEVKNVSKAYDNKQVFDNFSLDFGESGRWALLGPSGCGKTTLLRLISGLEKPDSGEIIFHRPAKISMVFQEDRLLQALDVRGNILAVLGKDAESRRLADECLHRCGLQGVADEFPASLSGGMQRRVAVARAIAFKGDILLLDEPFKGLDDDTKRQVGDFVFENDDNRLTILITHDKDEAQAYAKRILRFDGPPLSLAVERDEDSDSSPN